MANPKAVYGTFPNGIPFARVGKGSRTLLLFLGGPGNYIPGGMGLRALAGGFLDSTREYTVHLVTASRACRKGIRRSTCPTTTRS